MLQARLGMSQRRACVIVGQHRSTQRHGTRPGDPDRDLRARLRCFTKSHPRWGYRRAHAVLRAGGVTASTAQGPAQAAQAPAAGHLDHAG